MQPLHTALTATTTAAAPSAAGAPLDQILVVTAFSTLVYAAVAWVVLRERTGNRTGVGRLADGLARRTDLPRWFALPQLLTLAGIVSAVVGLYWDVSFHLAFGRDEGPLANPAHYFILVGLVVIFAGAALGVGLATHDLPRRTLRIGGSWRAPWGPVVSMAVGLIALLGFPLDDLWHRLFGQDVTEWGPTHVLMIGGTMLAAFGILLACAEAAQVRPGPRRLRDHLAAAALLIFLAGPAALLLEFAYGIPQFPLLADPLVLSLAAGTGFVFASLRGPRTVIGLWAAYLLVQFLLAGLNVVVLDALMPWPASLLGGAVVGVVAAGRARPTPAYGALAGAAIAIGTVLVDHLWTRALRPMPWPTEMLPQALVLAAMVGAGVGVVTIWLHVRLEQVADRHVPDPGRSLGALAAIGFATVLAAFVITVPPQAESGIVADVTVIDRTDTEARLRIEVLPHSVADDAWWLQTLSWQGGGAVHDELREASPGVFETTGTVPVHGEWKTLVRLHLPSRTLLAAPVYLPADEAIPVPGHPLADGPRPFVAEAEILRREERPDVPGWLRGTAYGVVGGLFLGLFLAIAAGTAAAARRGTGRREPVGADR